MVDEVGNLIVLWQDRGMFTWQTAGESHGPALVALAQGVPAGIAITTDDFRGALARRRLGHGRGARMKFEQDELTILAGVRHGRTLGSPIAVMIGNTEWPKWQEVMAADPVGSDVTTTPRGAPLTRPRPGHADLAGMLKFGHSEIRPVLERASARETAARVVIGTLAEAILDQVAGIRLVSHVTGVGAVSLPDDAPRPGPDDTAALDATAVRCLDPAVDAAMAAEIDAAHKDADTLGGVVEVIAYGVPVGLGTYVRGPERLDARIAGALMGIQAIKGVEIGDGFATARRRGSRAHDEMTHDGRMTNRAGGIEGGAGIEAEDLVQFGAGIADEQEDEQDAAAGQGHVRPAGRGGPLAEGLLQPVELDRVQAGVVVRSRDQSAQGWLRRLARGAA